MLVRQDYELELASQPPPRAGDGDDASDAVRPSGPGGCAGVRTAAAARHACSCSAGGCARLPDLRLAVTPQEEAEGGAGGLVVRTLGGLTLASHHAGTVSGGGAGLRR
jgi:hypothetical protein